MTDYAKLTKELCKSLNGKRWHDLAKLIEPGYKGTYVALRLLRDSDSEVVAGDFSRQMLISTARVAVLLRSLADKNFIERSKSETDGRKMIIRITPLGLQALEQRERDVQGAIGSFLEKLSETEADIFLNLVKKLSD